MPSAFTATEPGDVLADYWAVVDGVALWDAAPERLVVEIAGPDALVLTQMLVTRDLSSHEVGQCKYAFMTNRDGGIIGDPVILRLGEQRFWLSGADADVEQWCRSLADSTAADVEISAADVSSVQIQGPHASAVMSDIFGDEVLDIGYYRLAEFQLDGLDLVVSRSGWGVDLGFEVHLVDGRAEDHSMARRWHDMVMRAGERHDIVASAPSHIRRIEAGVLANGSDMDASTNPFELDMGYPWMVDLEQPDDFIGRSALRRIRSEGPTRRLVGVDITGPDLGAFAAASASYSVPVLVDDQPVGRLTSACHSPRLQSNIGYAMVDIEHGALGTEFTVAHSSLGRLRAVAVEKRRD